MRLTKKRHITSLIAGAFAAFGLLITIDASAANETEKSDTVEHAEPHNTETAKTECPKDSAHPYAHKCNKRYRLGTFYIAGGASFMDVDALNNRLERNGYNKWENPSVPIGLGFTMRAGRFVTGAEANRLLSSRFEAGNDEYRMDLKSWYWSINYGYDIVQWNGISVYPLVGIGAGHTEIWLSEEAGTSFDAALADPGRGTHMKQTSLVLKVALGVDYRFKIKETARKTTYVSVGIKGGYLFSAYSSDWSTGSAEVYNGPSRGLNGPDVQLMLGFSRQRHP